MRMQSTALVLTRERGQQRVGVVGPVAISAAYDLALLEADRPLPRHLRIARAVPLGRADQLHVAGFPRGRFATLRATQKVTTTTRGSFGHPLERIIEPGLSGGAVLAPNGDVVGISKTSSFNIASVIPAATVREFLVGAIGVRCAKAVGSSPAWTKPPHTHGRSRRPATPTPATSSGGPSATSPERASSTFWSRRRGRAIRTYRVTSRACTTRVRPAIPRT